jgi:hypothetical protein
MKFSAERINQSIAGFTDVVELKLQMDPSSGKYELTLALSDAQGKVAVLKCKDVSNLALSEVGGGLTQFLSLRAQDVRERQLDRVSFHFADVGRGSILFDCADASID